MKHLWIATACAFFATVAIADDVTVSVANGTDKTFESVTVYALDSRGEVLGGAEKALRPGRSATITLALPSCQAVIVQALWGSDGMVTTEADACDPAIFTLTE